MFSPGDLHMRCTLVAVSLRMAVLERGEREVINFWNVSDPTRFALNLMLRCCAVRAQKRAESGETRASRKSSRSQLRGVAWLERDASGRLGPESVLDGGVAPAAASSDGDPAAPARALARPTSRTEQAEHLGRPRPRGQGRHPGQSPSARYAARAHAASQIVDAVKTSEGAGSSYIVYLIHFEVRSSSPYRAELTLVP